MMHKSEFNNTMQPKNRSINGYYSKNGSNYNVFLKPG